MHAMKGLAASLALVFLFLLPAGGRGEEGVIHFVTPTAASSDCFGDASTPLCAVETLIGCGNYVRRDGCSLVGWGRSADLSEWAKDWRFKNNRIEYIFIKIRVLTPRRFRELMQTKRF